MSWCANLLALSHASQAEHLRGRGQTLRTLARNCINGVTLCNVPHLPAVLLRSIVADCRVRPHPFECVRPVPCSDTAAHDAELTKKVGLWRPGQGVCNAGELIPVLPPHLHLEMWQALSSTWH